MNRIVLGILAGVGGAVVGFFGSKVASKKKTAEPAASAAQEEKKD